MLEQLGCGCEFFPQVGDAPAKGAMLGKLHQANQVPASATTGAVEQILARVDIEGGMGGVRHKSERSGICFFGAYNRAAVGTQEEHPASKYGLESSGPFWSLKNAFPLHQIAAAAALFAISRKPLMRASSCSWRKRERPTSELPNLISISLSRN